MQTIKNFSHLDDPDYTVLACHHHNNSGSSILIWRNIHPKSSQRLNPLLENDIRSSLVGNYTVCRIWWTSSEITSLVFASYSNISSNLWNSMVFYLLQNSWLSSQIFSVWSLAYSPNHNRWMKFTRSHISMLKLLYMINSTWTSWWKHPTVPTP